jgi:RND family efflux transporter MFP subunit
MIRLTQVEVALAEKGGIARTTTQPAIVHAYAYVRLYAKVSGFLRAQVVDIGDTVERGQVVATVWAPELRQRFEEATAAVDQAKMQIEQARAAVTVAEAEVQAASASLKEAKARVPQYTAARKYRQKEFVRYTELAVSRAVDERTADEKQEDFESARAGEGVAIAGVLAAEAALARNVAGVEKAKADLKVAEAALRVAEARQAFAQTNVEYSRLVAPFNGVVTERNYHDGDFIRAPDTGGSSPPILTISRTDLMRVVLFVPDRDVPYVDRGDPAVIRIDALGGEEFKGDVSRYSNVEMSSNRAMRVEVDIPNPTGRLREGMYGNLSIQLDLPPDVLRVPSMAIIENTAHGQGAVYVAEEGRARRRAVRIGRDDGRVAEIISGISEADRIVVDYNGSMEDGEPIEVLPAPGARPTNAEN